MYCCFEFNMEPRNIKVLVNVDTKKLYFVCCRSYFQVVTKSKATATLSAAPTCEICELVAQKLESYLTKSSTKVINSHAPYYLYRMR